MNKWRKEGLKINGKANKTEKEEINKHGIQKEMEWRQKWNEDRQSRRGSDVREREKIQLKVTVCRNKRARLWTLQGAQITSFLRQYGKDICACVGTDRAARHYDITRACHLERQDLAGDAVYFVRPEQIYADDASHSTVPAYIEGRSAVPANNARWLRSPRPGVTSDVWYCQLCASAPSDCHSKQQFCLCHTFTVSC